MIIIDCLTESGGWLGKLTALSTLGLLIVTAFYAVQTKRTVDQMKKQNEIENKYKNIDMWDRALNDFFIPFKDMIARCSNIASAEHPSEHDLYVLINEANLLLRYWGYRVFDSKTINEIREYLGDMEPYIKDLNNSNSRKIFSDDCEFLIVLFYKNIKSIQRRLKYKDLD